MGVYTNLFTVPKKYSRIAMKEREVTIYSFNNPERFAIRSRIVRETI